MADFLSQVSGLGEKLGCLLIQLPPGLAFDAATADNFFSFLRNSTPVAVACESRHATWFTAEADDLLSTLTVARVAADPAKVPAAALPGGSRHFSYYRLHGSPKIYYSAYTAEYLNTLAGDLQRDHAEGRPVWCIFDNTTLGAAATNTLALQSLLQGA